MKKLKILIYKDYGQWFDSATSMKQWLDNLDILDKYIVEYVDADSIIKLNALLSKNVAALVMPGAHSRGYNKKLSGIGNQNIRDFVNSGGIYLGFCGGAYYACEKTIFAGYNLDLKDSYDLKLFRGLSIGSIPELCDGRYFDDTICSVSAASLSFNNKEKSYVYYSGGCCFSSVNQEFEVLARYDLLDIPAVIKFSYGEGKVVLSGVHPEKNYGFLANNEGSLKACGSKEKEIALDIFEKLNVSEKDGSKLKLDKVILQDLFLLKN